MRWPAASGPGGSADVTFASHHRSSCFGSARNDQTRSAEAATSAMGQTETGIGANSRLRARDQQLLGTRAETIRAAGEVALGERGARHGPGLFEAGFAGQRGDLRRREEADEWRPGGPGTL